MEAAKDWTLEEDTKFTTLISVYGTHNWKSIAEQFESKSAKQCRQRWHNHLNPDIKKGVWTAEEDKMILECQAKYGNAWAKIAKIISARTDNQIKNRYYSITRQPMFQRRFHSDEFATNMYLGQTLPHNSGIINATSIQDPMILDTQSKSTKINNHNSHNHSNQTNFPTESISQNVNSSTTIASFTTSISRTSVNTDTETVSEYNEYECSNRGESSLAPVTVAMPMKIRRIEHQPVITSISHHQTPAYSRSLAAVSASTPILPLSIPYPHKLSPSRTDLMLGMDWSFLLEERILPTPREGYNSQANSPGGMMNNSSNNSSNNRNENGQGSTHHIFSHDAIIHNRIEHQQQQQISTEDSYNAQSQRPPIDTSYINHDGNINSNLTQPQRKRRMELGLDLTLLGLPSETAASALSGLHSARLSARASARSTPVDAAIAIPLDMSSNFISNNVILSEYAVQSHRIDTTATITEVTPSISVNTSTTTSSSSPAAINLKPVPGHPYLFYDESHPMFLSQCSAAEGVAGDCNITALASAAIIEIEEVKEQK